MQSIFLRVGIVITTVLLVQGIPGIYGKSNGNSTSESSFTTAFSVCNKTAEIVPDWSGRTTHVATHLKAYAGNNCERIIQGANFSGNLRPAGNGFAQTVITAYNGHHNLVLRPDDVWIAIITQFSFYVNANAEEFRGKFVNFTGKKQLTVKAGGYSLDTAPYDYLVLEMTNLIHKNLIDKDIQNWILPNFTTTTKDDVVTCGVVLMATLKKYFCYKFSFLCGIPSISLEGSVEDWKEVQRKIKRFENYKLSKWVKMLDPILEQFVQAKSGNVDSEFWQMICHYKNSYIGTELSGWITAFLVFDEDGKWRGDLKEGKRWPVLHPDSVTPGVVEVDVLIDDNGIEYETVMLAGHMATQRLTDGYTVQPTSGWVIALKSKNASLEVDNTNPPECKDDDK